MTRLVTALAALVLLAVLWTPPAEAQLASAMQTSLRAAAKATATPAATPTPTAPKAYVTLGDSIAAMSTFTVGTQNYVLWFRDYLRSLDPTVDVNRLAVSGADSAYLLAYLRTYQPWRDAVRQARFVTISIGGNNLLGCVPTDTACGQAGVARFAADWPAILAEIRTSIGFTGRLFMLTVYTPYVGTDPNWALADPHAENLNAVIRDAGYRLTYDYRVAEAHDDFLGYMPDGVTWRVCAWTLRCTYNDPHPSPDGHRELSRLHEALYP